MDELLVSQRISKNIRALRLEHNMTVSELSEKLGISRPTLHSWESGNSTPSAVYIGILAQFFGVSTDSICSSRLHPRIDLTGLSYEDINSIRDFADYLRSKHNNETVTK